MIKPTIGRVMWYRPAHANPDAQAETALVIFVHDDTSVNLVTWDASGNQAVAHSVPVYQGEGDRPTVSYVEWMPYQREQAAKQEQNLFKPAVPSSGSKNPTGVTSEQSNPSSLAGGTKPSGKSFDKVPVLEPKGTEPAGGLTGNTGVTEKQTHSGNATPSSQPTSQQPKK